MECLYLPELNENTEYIEVSGDEFKHVKALRLREGDFISASNGTGMIAELQLSALKKENVLLKFCKSHQNKGEINNKLTLAMGIISDRSRFEFAIEKAVELGATEIIPLITDYSEKKSISTERLNSKVIAALKQSKRSKLTKINQPVIFKNLSINFNDYQNILLADSDGMKPDSLDLTGNTIVFIGPEGGFSRQEQDFLKYELHAKLLNLGNRRLRAETAVISALAIISMKLTK